MTRPVVLLIDSDDAQRQAHGDVVRRAGCWLLPAAKVEDAVVLCSKIRPSLIVTASSLIDGDVGDLLAKLRPIPALASVPVLVLPKTEGDMAPSLSDDRVRWVSPPPSPDALKALIEEGAVRGL